MNKDLRDFSFIELSELFSSIGEKKFRAVQLFSWLHQKNAVSFEELTNFSKDMRKYLSDNFTINSLTIEDKQVSEIDGSVKYLFRTADNYFIESVLLRNPLESGERITICVSSQAGCAMGCTFCQTAKNGFNRSLNCGEILTQISLIRKDSGVNNSNVVFMGMGEPFNNYDNVIKAAHLMNDDRGFNISVRRITISTCGILPSIERFLDEKQPFKMALSLNDTDPEKRASTMPVERKYPMKSIIALLEKKFKTSKHRLTLEYVMRNDNTGMENIKDLKKMFKNISIKINLIPLNPGSHDHNKADQKQIDEFIKNIEKINVPVSVRKSLGQDIDGACGQLSGKKYEKEALCLNQ